MMAPASAPLDAVAKGMAIWDLPYLFKDQETAHRVLDGEVGQEVFDSMSDKGDHRLSVLGKWFSTLNQ